MYKIYKREKYAMQEEAYTSLAANENEASPTSTIARISHSFFLSHFLSLSRFRSFGSLLFRQIKQKKSSIRTANRVTPRNESSSGWSFINSGRILEIGQRSARYKIQRSLIEIVGNNNCGFNLWFVIQIKSQL